MNCKKILKSTSYTVGNSFNINITNESITDLENCERFVLILTQNLPAMTTIVPVYLVINGQNYPVQDLIGNNLMSDQLKYFPQSRNCCVQQGVARIIFGSNPNHFKVLQCLPQSSAVGFVETTETVAINNANILKTAKVEK